MLMGTPSEGSLAMGPAGTSESANRLQTSRVLLAARSRHPTACGPPRICTSRYLLSAVGIGRHDAREAHNPEVDSSNLSPATTIEEVRGLGLHVVGLGRNQWLVFFFRALRIVHLTLVGFVFAVTSWVVAMLDPTAVAFPFWMMA